MGILLLLRVVLHNISACVSIHNMKWKSLGFPQGIQVNKVNIYALFKIHLYQKHLSCKKGCSRFKNKDRVKKVVKLKMLAKKWL